MARKSKTPTYSEVVNAASTICNDKFMWLVSEAIVREFDGRKLNTVGWCFDGPTTIKVFTLNGTELIYLYIDLACVYDADYHMVKIKHGYQLHALRANCERYRQMIADHQREIDNYRAEITGITHKYEQIAQEVEKARTVKLVRKT